MNLWSPFGYSVPSSDIKPQCWVRLHISTYRERQIRPLIFHYLSLRYKGLLMKKEIKRFKSHTSQEMVLAADGQDCQSISCVLHPHLPVGLIRSGIRTELTPTATKGRRWRQESNGGKEQTCLHSLRNVQI